MDYLIVKIYLFSSQKEFGEIMFGLSYLPTAQRVSFSILKTANLKFDKIVDTVEKFRKYKDFPNTNQSEEIWTSRNKTDEIPAVYLRKRQIYIH